MDRTDLAIFLEMFRDRVVWVGGWDRSKSAAQVARRLGLATSTVNDRLRAWRRVGFFRGLKIFPHPSLFGARYRSVNVTVRSSASFAPVERMMGLIPDLAHALEGEWGYWVILLAESDRSVARAIELFRTIPKVEVEEQWPVDFPDCTEPVNIRDWEVLSALAREPESTPAAVGRRLGFAPKTAARRIDRLVRDHVVFFHPVTDFSRTQGTFRNFRLRLAPGTSTAEFWEGVAALDPHFAPQADWLDDRLAVIRDAPDHPHANELALFWYFESGAQVTERARQLARLPGVEEVQSETIIRVWRGPSCIPDRVDGMLAALRRRPARPPLVRPKSTPRSPGLVPSLGRRRRPVRV